MKSSTEAIELVRLLEIASARRPRSPPLGSGDERTSSYDRAGGVTVSSIAADDQRRHGDCGRAVALVGEPDRLGADAIGGGVDARHGLDDFAANGRDRRAGRGARRRAPRPSRHVAAAGDASGRRSRGLRDARRRCRRGSATRRLGRGVVHGDGDDSAERQAADVCAVDAERVHRGQDRGGIIVARGAVGGGSLSP